MIPEVFSKSSTNAPPFLSSAFIRFKRSDSRISRYSIVSRIPLSTSQTPFSFGWENIRRNKAIRTMGGNEGWSGVDAS